MAVVLISFLHSWPGAVEAQCALCGEGVYEQQANLDRMKAENGWVICVACALALKTVLSEPVVASSATRRLTDWPPGGRGNA